MLVVLTGILAPTEGTAKIAGLDINEDIEDIREIIGVVPQFDILWDNLTAEEHMIMFCKIKGIPALLIAGTIDSKLKSVKLFDVKKGRVGSFSGGMKRRLSVAIACIGDPQVVFMDEPTTGMDPVSRLSVWKLIQELRQNRIVILTTHSMEEADYLSDRIAVIVDGEFKCIGTPLYLKNTYGDGYRISMITGIENVGRVLHLMASIVPSARLLDEAGGSLVFGCPVAKVKELGPVMDLIIKKDPNDEIIYDNPKMQELREIVIDCGVS